MSTPGLLHRILLHVTSFLSLLVRPLRFKGSGIPSVGPSAPVLSILGAFRFFSNAQGVITEGYTKYKHDVFKIAQLDHWLYIACDRRIAEEVNEAPEEVLSLTEAMDEVFQTKYTIRVAMRDCIARSRPSLLHRPYPTELAQDCRRTLEELLSAEDPTTEWKALPIYRVIEDVLHRVSNLFFLGETFYKNEEYIELNKTYTTRILEAAVYYHVVPGFLRPIFSKFYDPLAPLIERASRLLQPEFQSREEKSKEYGRNWPGRDDDMLATLMEFGNDMFNDKRTLVISLLTVNVATVHSTSQSFMHALYRIAGNPEYAEALREEIREITEKDGWNTDALSKMRKLDSFLRESLRMCSVTALVLSKLAKQDFKLSDGRIIPKGSVIATPATAIHWEGDLYEDPGVFKPWRFLTDDKNEGRVLQNTATDASPEFLAFANGEHACPGRFFAVVTIKACLAHILLTYDVKFEKEGTDPKPVWFVTACRPDPSVRVLFKRR